MNPWSVWWQWWTLTNALMGYSMYYPMWWLNAGGIFEHSQMELRSFAEPKILREISAGEYVGRSMKK